jgi:molybdopterin converting factor small subunit
VDKRAKPRARRRGRGERDVSTALRAARMPLRCATVPTVKIPPVLRPSTGGVKEVDAGGSTVGEVLRALAVQHPATESQLFSEEGQLNRYVNVYLNDEDVRVLDGLSTPVGETDTIVILPAMAGGTTRFS